MQKKVREFDTRLKETKANSMICLLFLLLITTTAEGCESDIDCQRSGDPAAYCKANGACRCDPPHFGDLCDKIQCSDPYCSHHGTCNTTDGICNCDVHHGGVNCSEIVCPGIHHNCSNHGLCVNGNCTCFDPYEGEACDELKCPRNGSDVECSYPNGYCDHQDGTCKCNHGWMSSDCSVPAPTPEHCTICLDVSESSYCKCNLEEPLCQGTTDVRCDACCSNGGEVRCRMACTHRISSHCRAVDEPRLARNFKFESQIKKLEKSKNMPDKKLSEMTSKQSYIGKYKHLHAVEVCGVVLPSSIFFSAILR